jgi:hypothetical protein
MKHPFSGEYIKMAAAAGEVQAIRLGSKLFEAGDFVIFESAFTPTGMVSPIDEHSHGVPQDNARVWLPQLRQLMDLFGDFRSSLEAFSSALGSQAGAPDGYFDKFKSWEEVTLAVLMLRKAGKIWNGQAWQLGAPPTY